MHFTRLVNTLLKDEESARDNHVFAYNFAKYLPILKITDRLRNTPFLMMWLLTTPPHLQYVATLPRNLSLMACFTDINVSQGSVATYEHYLRLHVRYDFASKSYLRKQKNVAFFLRCLAN